MNDLTPLTLPSQAQVKIDSVAKECPPKGFNFPVFRQLNKHARIYLSRQLELNSSTAYNLFDVANSKGWFVAVKQAPTGSDLIFSSLESLRSAFASATESPDNLFVPKRTISVASRINIVRFAGGDSRLLVAQENGLLLAYDTTQLFSEGSNDVQPLFSNQISSTYLHQVVPNPGTEPGLSDLIAVVSDGKVQLLNLSVEFQGGWVASDLMTQPICVSWSPKGKHLAIGLQTGDILTFSPMNRTTPHKHIPPTHDTVLVSLNWLAPGHTFRTSYAPNGEYEYLYPTQHIVILDVKTSTASYFAPVHPYCVTERHNQSSYVLTIPKWDVDSASNDENKFLNVIADAASVDVEVLGNIANSWYREVQDNPVNLPLTIDMDDPILVGFEHDFTDSAAAAPVIFAYLNDGSLQGWRLEHSKPYSGIIVPNMAASLPTSRQNSGPSDADMGAEESHTSNSFAQSGMANQTGFGQQAHATSAFGSNTTSTFGQTGFGQKSPETTSAFGQPSFGQPSAFGAATGFGSTSAFGQPSQSSASGSPFGDTKPASGFGAFGGSSSAFGNTSSSVFGSSNAFGGSNSGTPNAFGQSSFGNNQSTQQSMTSMTREASMSDSTSTGFGGLGLGSATPSDPNARNSMFGSFSNTTSSDANTTSQSGGFGSGPLVKPATGFGAFGATKPSSTFEAPKPAPSTSAFGAPSQPSTGSGFGQSGFANPAFGKSGFGQPAFGQPAFGQPAFGKPSLGGPSTSTTTAPTKGGFGAFANATTTFGSAAQATKPTSSSSGFGAFASTTPSAFGSTQATSESKPAFGSGGGFSAFASSTPSAFGATTENSETSPKETPKATSAFGGGGGFGAFASNTPSAFGPTTEKSDTTSKETPKSTSAFGGAGGGFSAFASTTPSAFGSTAEKPDTTSKEVRKTASAFSGSATTVSSPFATTATPIKDTTPRGSVFGTSAFGATTSSKSSSAFATPARSSPFAASNDSPEHASPPSSPEPAKSTPSAFAAISTTPSSTPNAFSNLQTTPSAFKPASGFGAFGSFGDNSSSPFFKKPDATPPPVSAFANVGTTPKTPSSVSAAPAFGSTSTLGGPKSVFAPVTPSTTTPSKAPTSGGFGAFSGASSSFSSYVGTKTSFSDLLKTGGDEAKDPVKSPALSTTPKTDKDSASTAPTSVFATPTPLKKESPAPSVSAFAPISKMSDTRSENKKAVSDEASYGSISASSASSSFVDITAEETRDEDERHDEARSDDDAEHSGDDDDDDSRSFLSEDYNEEYPEVPSDDEESEEHERSPSPETVAPTKASRSPSATPRPETPSIKVSLSPDEDTEEQPSQPTSSEQESGITPPATPAKESKEATPPPGTPGSSSSLSPFGIGIGRPSSRPSPRSPVISDTIEEEDEDDEDGELEETVIAQPIPVSPKSPVAIMPVKLDEESSTKRPKTPPLLSTLSGKSPKPKTPSLPPTAPIFGGSPLASSSGGLGTLAKAAASSPSVLGKTTTTPDKTASQSNLARPATVPPNLSGTTPSFTSPPVMPSLFGQSPFGIQNVSAAPALAGQAGTSAIQPPKLPGQGIFGTSLPGPGQQSFSLFGGSQPQAAKVPAPPLFGGSTVTTPPKSNSPFSLPTAQSTMSMSSSFFTSPPAPPIKDAKAELEEGMQKECMNLVAEMENEAQKMASVINVAKKIVVDAYISRGGSYTKADLGDFSKWGPADLPQFKRLLCLYERDLAAFEASNDKDQQKLRELRSNMLKAHTRREEIVRFNKAKNDKDFAKMLRSRTLGPEHSETQIHLRKSIRVVRDRIQKLETHLQEDKKKLAQSTSYKPSFRAPSLDTINRTYRNIELAIEQQSDEVSRLAARISKLDIEANQPPVVRDRRLAESDNRRSLAVTPNVAASTAAALNAERSARRLKDVLLKVRSKPLLNVKAASAPSALIDMPTPKKPSMFDDIPKIDGVSSEWDIPPSNFNPIGTSPLSEGPRTTHKSKKHMQPTPFQRHTSPLTGSSFPARFTSPSPAPSASSSTPPGFEWGPLPNFSAKPK